MNQDLMKQKITTYIKTAWQWHQSGNGTETLASLECLYISYLHGLLLYLSIVFKGGSIFMLVRLSSYLTNQF